MSKQVQPLVFLFLLFATPQITHTYDLFAELLHLFFGSPQQTHQLYDTHDVHASIDEYCFQLQHDLKGIPQQDIDAIVAKLRNKLTVQGKTVSANYATQLTKSVIIEHVKATAKSIASKKLTAEGVSKMEKSFGENVRVRLERINHINGESIAQYFGTSLESKIASAAQHKENRLYLKSMQKRLPLSTPYYNQPRPPYHQPTSQPLDARTYQQVCDEQEAALRYANMDEADITEFKKSFWDSQSGCPQERYRTQNGIVQCGKCKITALLIQKARLQSKEIAKRARNKHDVTHATNEIAKHINAALPDNGEPINSQNIKRFCTDLEGELIAEMNVTCPICYQEYSDKMKDGTAGNKVALPCNSKHHLCPRCRSQVTQCPICRSDI